MRVRTVQRDGRPCVQLNGEASAGVDLDRNRPTEGDQVDFEFAFKIETQPGLGGEVVLCTTGRGDRPLRVVVNGREPDLVQVRLDGALTVVGRLDVRGWTPVRMQISSDACSVSVGDGKSVAVVFPTADVRLYLGQGYLEDRVSPRSAFLADLSTMRSRAARRE